MSRWTNIEFWCHQDKNDANQKIGESSASLLGSQLILCQDMLRETCNAHYRLWNFLYWLQVGSNYLYYFTEHKNILRRTSLVVAGEMCLLSGDTDSNNEHVRLLVTQATSEGSPTHNRNLFLNTCCCRAKHRFEVLGYTARQERTKVRKQTPSTTPNCTCKK